MFQWVCREDLIEKISLKQDLGEAIGHAGIWKEEVAIAKNQSGSRLGLLEDRAEEQERSRYGESKSMT